MIDACGTEQYNEFVIIHSGSSGFNTNNIIVDFPIGNNAMSTLNNDINTDVDNYPPGTPCGLITGNPGAYSGCSNIIAIGPGFNVPPNQIVVFQISAGSTNGLYDFSSLCGNGQCIYVISNSCQRTIGGFTNSSTGTRTTIFDFGGGCSHVVTYDFANFSTANGAYYLPLADTYGNNGCVAPPSSPAQDPTTPTFTVDNQYCVGETPDILPGTSNNGISGTWSPAVINTSVPGNANYIFTPAAGQCAVAFTLQVTVTANVIPTFSFQTQYCQNQTPANLPGTSDNGITGTWSPAVINTSSPGTTQYTFTPSAGQCATTVMVAVTIDPLINPLFTIDNQYCQGETPDILPNTSNNGVSGSWNPASINTSAPGTTTYTFTPNMGQCASIFQLSVTVNPNVTPAFNVDNTYCVGDTPDNLPGISTNGITGTWNPAVINTSSSGMASYTFTPNPGQCASNFVLSVTVSNNVTPTFAPIGDICEGGNAPTLPATSLNGITGSWAPPVINTATPGSSSYTFTPNPGQCANPVTISVNILEVPRGFISGNVNICPGQCGEVSFNLTGGSGLYTLNMQISVGPFNIPFIIPGATFSTVLEICYTGTDFFPVFQPPSTLILPLAAPPGTATLTLLAITDGNGGPCPNGTITNNTMSLTLRTRPVANNAQLTVCDDDNDGIGIFNLTQAEGTVTGNNSNLSVTWYADSNLSNQINNPTMYSATGGTVVYALVEDQFGCTDDSEVTLLLQMPGTPDLPTFTVCVTGAPLNLPTNVNGISGNWSDVNGHVNANQFDPNGLAEGNYTITFNPNPGQCYIAANTTVTVTSGGPIPLDGIPATVCLGAGTLILPDLPGGVTGNWSSPSPHLTGNIFNVAAAGTGIYDFTFTPDDPNSCFLPNTIQVEVIPNATLTPPVFTGICENSGLYSLGSTVNGVSGSWGNSPHVTNNQFNTNAVPGTYMITFFPNDDCTNDAETTITIIPATNLTPLVFSNLCNSSPPISLPMFVQSVPGVWTLNSVIITEFNPQVSGNGTFDLVFTPIPGSCANGFTSPVTVGSVYAGEDRTENFCTTQTPVINLQDYLSTTANPGGAWAIDGNPISDPIAFDLAALPEGNHTFTYILSDPVCGNDTAFLVFTLQRMRMAGNDGNLEICQSDRASVNFAATLGPFSTGGIWTNTRNANIDFSDPGQVNLNSLPSGNTLFTYRFDVMVCPGDTATISVRIDSLLSAGPDRTGNICINSVTNLNTLIASGFQGGSFEDFNSYGGLTGSSWDANGKAEGDYVFHYLRTANGVCPGDTAIVIVSVQANISAGEDVTGEYCDGQGFIASDFLPASASPGGKIFNGPFEVPFGMEILGNLQQYQFLYITGDGVTCPYDTAVWTINKINRPNINFITNILTFCEGQCADLIIRHNSNQARDVEMRNSANFAQLVRLIPGQDLRITLCSDESNPDSFNNLPVGISIYRLVTLFEASCAFDLGTFNVASTIRVDETNQVNVNETLCPGESLQVGTTVFNENNPTGTVTVPGTGNNCDTLYTVNLSFHPVSRGNFTRQTCDANYSILIGNQTFNRNNPSGSVTLPNVSFFGCDSIVDVALTFLSPVSITITERTCNSDFAITIGNTTFNANNPSGQVTLNGQAANGCDSIVNVNLTFLNPSVSRIDTTACDPNFSLIVGNTTFNTANPSGEVVLQGGAANGCDSTVLVNLTFENFFAGENIILPECGENTGRLLLQAMNPNGPFTLFVNGIQQPDIPVLPFERSFSPGSYQVNIISPEGCGRVLAFVIPDNSLPQITIDSSNTGGDVYSFNLQGDTDRIFNISWSPASIFSCSDCISTIATPLVDTEVLLQYDYGSGCAQTLRFTLRKSVAGEFEIPNIIKPGSGANGRFYINAPENFSGTITAMSVYDRWGDKVFSANNVALGDPESGWDGSFANRDVIPGVYVYVVEILNFSGNTKIVLQGDLTVLR